MSGHVGRTPCLQVLPFKQIEFLMDKKNKSKEMIFKSREEAVEYFRKVEHLANDDIQFLFWFEEGEDLKRNLLSGDLLVPLPPPDWIPEDDILPEDEEEEEEDSRYLELLRNMPKIEYKKLFPG